MQVDYASYLPAKFCNLHLKLILIIQNKYPLRSLLKINRKSDRGVAASFSLLYSGRTGRIKLFLMQY